MWLWGEQWEEKEKKKKKSRGHSTLDLVHLPMPATRPLDFHSNRVGHRAGRGMNDNHNRETARISAPSVPIPSFSVQRWISPLSFFFFLPIEKTRRKGRKRNESKRAFERLVREIVASPLSSLLRTYFRSRIAKEWFEWRRLKPRFSLPSSFPPPSTLARNIRARESFPLL